MGQLNKDSPDLWEFARALYLHGANGDTLKTVLPNWPKCEIEMLLRKYKGRAARERLFLQGDRKARQAMMQVKQEKASDGAKIGKNRNLPPLLTWAELVRKVHGIQNTSDKNVFGVKVPRKAPIKDHSTVISKVLLYAACFEDHFHGSGEDDVLYSEIYRYLSQLLSGEEPTQLRAKSAAKVLEMVTKLTEMLQTGAFNDRLQYIQKLNLDNITPLAIGDDVPPPLAFIEKAEDAPLFGESPSLCNISSLVKAVTDLDAKDPYFEEKRVEINSKFIATQQLVAQTLHNSRGLNPLNLPPQIMTKPLKAFPSDFPARNVDGLYSPDDGTGEDSVMETDDTETNDLKRS